MKTPTLPHVQLDTDNENQIMSRSGSLAGWSGPLWSGSLFVWRFGFLPGSDSAKAHGVSMEVFIWVIADYFGNILERFEGFGCELPPSFTKILEHSNFVRAKHLAHAEQPDWIWP